MIDLLRRDYDTKPEEESSCLGAVFNHIRLLFFSRTLGATSRYLWSTVTLLYVLVSTSGTQAHPCLKCIIGKVEETQAVVFTTSSAGGSGNSAARTGEDHDDKSPSNTPPPNQDKSSSILGSEVAPASPTSPHRHRTTSCCSITSTASTASKVDQSPDLYQCSLCHNSSISSLCPICDVGLTQAPTNDHDDISPPPPPTKRRHHFDDPVLYLWLQRHGLISAYEPLTRRGIGIEKLFRLSEEDIDYLALSPHSCQRIKEVSRMVGEKNTAVH